jgi:uncharacterized membrane protein
MEIILLAVIASLQAAMLVVVFVGTNFRDRAWQIPVIGNTIYRLIRHRS